jgi:hypothetical protein
MGKDVRLGLKADLFILFSQQRDRLDIGYRFTQ